MDDLKIRQKCEEMIAYGYVAIRQFPKFERHVLGAEIRAAMWNVLRLIIVTNKRYHKKTTMQDLDAELGLRTNSKTQVFPVRTGGQAVDFLGYRIWPTHRALRKDSIHRMKRKMRRMARLYHEGRMTWDEIDPVIMSWIGHARHADTYNLRSKVLGGVGFVPPPLSVARERRGKPCA